MNRPTSDSRNVFGVPSKSRTLVSQEQGFESIFGAFKDIATQLGSAALVGAKVVGGAMPIQVVQPVTGPNYLHFTVLYMNGRAITVGIVAILDKFQVWDLTNHKKLGTIDPRKPYHAADLMLRKITLGGDPQARKIYDTITLRNWKHGPVAFK
jgi:hypothetical protein